MASSRMKIKTGDNVIVLTGKDRTKTGKVGAVNYEKGRVQVEGLHEIIKHQKPGSTNKRGSLEKVTDSLIFPMLA